MSEIRGEMADGATSDGSELTSSLDSKETVKLQLHAVSMETGGKNPAFAEKLADKHQRNPPEKIHVTAPDKKRDNHEPPILSTVFEECQECKIIRTNLDRITRLISSDSSAGPTWFAQKLEEKAFIANAADAVVLGYSRYEQISRLMSAIKGKISASQEPKREFSKFIAILESNPQSVDLARELGLENAFEECQYLDRITWLISSILEVVDVSADEDDLSEVRSALLPIASRWKDVGIELKSKLADLDSKQAVHPNSPDYLRNAVSRWLQKGYNTTKHGPPTWRKLVRAILVDAGGNRKNPALAEKLADWQGGKPPEKLNDPAVKQEPPNLPTGKQSITRSDKQTSASTGNGLKPTPYIHPEVTITQRNYRMIKIKFASLIRRASNMLQTKRISTEDLVLFLEAVYSSEDSKDGSDFAAAVTESSSTISEIFRAIGKQGLWSYWDYFLLQSLVEEFVSDDTDLQMSIQQYGEELTGFFFTTTIESYLEEVVRSSPPSDSEQLPSPCPDNKLFSQLSLKFKLDRDITKRSLEYIRQLWESLGKKSRLPLHTILLQKVEEGCICITWMIPFHLMHQLVRGLCESAAYFKEQHVLWVSVDGVYLYKEQGAQLSEFPSEENEKVHSVRATALFAAVEHGNTEAVDLLLSQSLNPNMLNKDNKTALDVAVEHEQLEVIELLVGREAMIGEGMPEMLHEACRSGDLDGVTALLSNGLNVDCKDEDGVTALVAASREGHSQIVDSLLKAGAKPDLQANNGVTALLLASQNGHTQIVESLLKAGASHDLQDNNGVTAAMLASWNGHTQIVESLLKAGADPDLQNKDGFTALVFASQNGHSQTVDSLLKAGANPNLQSNDGVTALVAASKNGHTQTVDSLLKAEANPDLKENNGVTALMFGSLNGHTQTVDSLLKAGANPDLQNKDGFTAVMLGSLIGHTLTVDSLLKAGANPDLKENDGFTAVMFGSLKGHTQTVDSLLKAGANPDLQNINGVTALVDASQEGHTQIVDSLLKAGANPDLKDNDGVTALLLASRDGHSQIVESLLKAGAHHDLQNKNGVTALLVASLKGHCRIVDSLLKAGAKPDLQYKNGLTALVAASKNGHTQIVDSLLKAGANPDLKENDGGTAVMFASLEGHTQIVDSLLKAGANPDLQSNDGETALTIAYYMERVHIIRLLLKARANPDHVTMGGKCPLLIAVRKRNKEVAQELISAGANPNYIAEDGFNALMLSCTGGYLEMVDLLLSSSADPNLKQPQTGYTALMLAAKAGHLEIVRKLASCGANLDETDKDGMTAADIACANSQSEVHQELLKCGAHQGSLIEPQAPAERKDVVGELLKAFLKRMDKKSLLEMKSILGDIRSDASTKGLLRDVGPVDTRLTEHVF